MPVLFIASVRFLTRHPWQLALAIVAIATGVAVIAAVDLANQSARRAFALSMEAVTGSATHQIIGGPGGVDERLYTRLRVDQGLRNIAPIVDGYVQIAGQTLYLLGVDPIAEVGFRNYALASNEVSSIELFRRLLTEPGAIVLSPATAEALELSIDDRFELNATGKPYSATLAGLIETDHETEQALRDVVLVDIAWAQSWLGMSGKLTRIDVRIEEGETGVRYRTVLANSLSADTRLLNAEGRTQTALEMSTAFATNLTAMSLLALLVGVFLIYNAMSFAVLQRRTLIGILRAIGVTRRQVFSMIVVEGLALGVIGTTIGIILGIELGDVLVRLVSRSINDHYFVVNIAQIGIEPASLLKAIVAGLGATLLAVCGPAIEAARPPPAMTLARSGLEARARATAPVLAVFGVLTAALGGLTLLLSDSNLLAGFLALSLLVLGSALCVPLVVRVFARGLTSLVAGHTARVAVRGVAAALSRTGVAVAALAIAISATIGVSVMVDSFRESLRLWLDSTLQSDIYVRAAGPSTPGISRHIDPELIPELIETPGVIDHSAVRQVWLETERGRTVVIALERAARSHHGVRLLQGDSEALWSQFEADDVVVVSDPYAYRRGVEVGDRLALPTTAGLHPFRVAGIYQDYGTELGTVLMSRSTYLRHWDDTRLSSIGLYLSPAADRDEVMGRLRGVGNASQALLVRSNRDIRELSLSVFDRTFVITDVLYWITVGVAFVAVLGAMLALQLERAKEHAILRALGMTPAQLGGLIGVQTGFIGLVAGVVAIPLGLMMSAVLIEVINRRAFGWQIDLLVPGDVLVAAVGLAVGSALLAGLYPAWQVARTPPAIAMREE